MVLWEITLGTAYFLGLKRTYRLALTIQRTLISAEHPKIRQFVQRRTRYVFDLALQAHLKIQERDIEVGRNLGNWILRYLDRMKPSAQIKGPPPSSKSIANNMHGTKQVAGSSDSGSASPKYSSRSGDREPDRHLFGAARNMWSKPFPSITMTRPGRSADSSFQHRQ